MKKWGLILILILMVSCGDLNAQGDLLVVRSDLPQEFAAAQSYSILTGIPLISIRPDTLDNETKELLNGYLQSGNNKIIIIGGPGAISLKVQQEMDNLGFVTKRIAEADRYGTAAIMAIELYEKSPGAVILNGEEIQDLLMAQRLAAKSGYPIMFIKKDEVPATVINSIGILECKEAYVFRDDISESAMESLEGLGLRVIFVEDNSVFSFFNRDNSRIIYFVLVLIGMIVGLSASYAYLRINNKNKKLVQKVSYTLLNEDEEKIVKIIEEAGGELTQDTLPGLSDYSRPKISRVIADLVERDILWKEPKGRTFVLKLKKEFFREDSE